MMGRWTPSGYPAPNVFAGATFCRFRLCHVRDDGLTVMTLGHYVERGGRLAPIMPGFNFISWVVRDAAGEVNEAPEELERAACNDPATALAQHMALLKSWEGRDIPS